jgi:hypothetical protein
VAKQEGTLGSLGFGSRLHRSPAAHPVLAGFDVDMAALIAERGADAAIVGLRPPACPRCGSVRTEVRLCVLG